VLYIFYIYSVIPGVLVMLFMLKRQIRRRFLLIISTSR